MMAGTEDAAARMAARKRRLLAGGADRLASITAAGPAQPREPAPEEKPALPSRAGPSWDRGWQQPAGAGRRAARAWRAGWPEPHPGHRGSHCCLGAPRRAPARPCAAAALAAASGRWPCTRCLGRTLAPLTRGARRRWQRPSTARGSCGRSWPRCMLPACRSFCRLRAAPQPRCRPCWPCSWASLPLQWPGSGSCQPRHAVELSLCWLVCPAPDACCVRAGSDCCSLATNLAGEPGQPVRAGAGPCAQQAGRVPPARTEAWQRLWLCTL